MAPHSTLRASDADREAVAKRLRDAAVEGRLEPDELEERLHAALRARTYGDLQRLLTDLPRVPAVGERRRVPAARSALTIATRVAITLAAVAVVATVIVALAAWWLFWVLVWVVACSRRGCVPGRHLARSGWGHPPRARRLQPQRPARLF